MTRVMKNALFQMFEHRVSKDQMGYSSIFEATENTFFPGFEICIVIYTKIRHPVGLFVADLGCIIAKPEWKWSDSDSV